CQEAVRHALSRRGFFNGALAASFTATAMAPEMALGVPARSFTSVVDLTHTMSPDFPTFFGVPGIEMDKKFEFKKDGFNLYWWRIIEHAGTHLGRTDPFLGGWRHGRKNFREHAGRAARGGRRGGQGGAESRLFAHARGSRRLGEEAPSAARELLRGDAIRLGTTRGQPGQIHRQR